MKTLQIVAKLLITPVLILIGVCTFIGAMLVLPFVLLINLAIEGRLEFVSTYWDIPDISFYSLRRVWGVYD